uniref:non-specific serine/threonine protein kinase n=1 Tax=Oryza barthii TaxID=65489 RepID=A0A0D3HU74_9ORYZ
MLVLLGSIIWRRCSDHRRRVQQEELELLGIMGPSRFQLQDLVAATGNFADENKLGQGGFGPVYKGYLRDQDLHVAIKVLSRRQSCQEQSAQGLREFKAEVKVMTQLRHRNIVKLVGWSDSKKQLLLIYELMAQGSLDKHLYDPEKILTWQQRYKIVLDLGSALLYLHHDCEKCIVHGDIKPANVMLDVSHNAKLGDFGLARLVEHGGEPQTTQPRTELDVYSFGIVLLEIACGKRPASRQLPNGASSLLAWVRDLYDQGKILDAVDQRLNGEFNQQQMERVIVMGLCCSHQDPIQRSSIVQAMDVLRSADAELPVPPAAHDTGHIRSMQEQAYADLPVEDHSVHTATRSTYFTSKDSVYLLAEG